MLDFGFYNMDCNDALKDFPDDFFDLAIVDPPYGIKVFSKDNASRSKLAASKNYKTYAGGDISAPDPEYFRQLKRISKNQIIFGANHFIDSVVEGFGGGVIPLLDRLGQGKRTERFRGLRTCVDIIPDSRPDLPVPLGGYAAGEHERKGNQDPPDTKAGRALQLDFCKLHDTRSKDHRHTRRIRVVIDSGAQQRTVIRRF